MYGRNPYGFLSHSDEPAPEPDAPFVNIVGGGSKRRPKKLVTVRGTSAVSIRASGYTTVDTTAREDAELLLIL